ncbi:MAG: helix-turn-helix domain-containing protein [Bacteroidota bacterium]
MKLQYHNKFTQGKLFLFREENGLNSAQFSDGREEKLFTFIWNKGNTQKVIIDEITHEFPSNTILPLMYNQNFHIENPEDIAVWQFNREFYCIIDHDKELGCVGFLYYNSSKTMFIALNDGETQKFDMLTNMFIDEMGQSDNIQGEMLRMLLGNLIIKLTRLAKTQFLNRNIDEHKLTIVREFNFLVEHHFRKQHTVQFYADQLAKSSKTLSNLFKLYNDKSPLQVIHHRIALEAKRLINYTDKSIKEIAYDLGFEDAAHFSRFFKKQTGLNPTSTKLSFEVSDKGRIASH